MAMAPPAWPSAPPPQRNRLFGGSQVKLINEFAEPSHPTIAPTCHADVTGPLWCLKRSPSEVACINY